MQFQDLRLTYADSVPQLGGRKPLNPSLKDGVVIRSLITLIAEYENADYFTRKMINPSIKDGVAIWLSSISSIRKY